MAKPVLSSVNVFDATEGVIAFFKIYVSYTSPNIIKEYEYIWQSNPKPDTT